MKRNDDNRIAKLKKIIMKRIILIVVITIIGVAQTVSAQDVALKTNLLADAFFNPNMGVEIGFAPKWTLDITGQFNAWTLSHERRWKHIRRHFPEAVEKHNELVRKEKTQKPL